MVVRHMRMLHAYTMKHCRCGSLERTCGRANGTTKFIQATVCITPIRKAYLLEGESVFRSHGHKDCCGLTVLINLNVNPVHSTPIKLLLTEHLLHFTTCCICRVFCILRVIIMQCSFACCDSTPRTIC